MGTLMVVEYHTYATTIDARGALCAAGQRLSRLYSHVTAPAPTTGHQRSADAPALRGGSLAWPTRRGCVGAAESESLCGHVCAPGSSAQLPDRRHPEHPGRCAAI